MRDMCRLFFRGWGSGDRVRVSTKDTRLLTGVGALSPRPFPKYTFLYGFLRFEDVAVGVNFQTRKNWSNWGRRLDPHTVTLHMPE